MRRLITNGSLCALKRTSCAEAADFRLVPLADVEGLAALLMYRATCRSTPRYPKKG